MHSPAGPGGHPARGPRDRALAWLRTLAVKMWAALALTLAAVAAGEWWLFLRRWA